MSPTTFRHGGVVLLLGLCLSQSCTVEPSNSFSGAGGQPSPTPTSTPRAVVIGASATPQVSASAGTSASPAPGGNTGGASASPTPSVGIGTAAPTPSPTPTLSPTPSPTPTPTPQVRLSIEVQPIFTANCTTSGCHTGGAPAGGMNLTSGQTFTNTVNVSAQGGTGIRVVANNPDGSVLVQKLGTSPPFGSRMPLGRTPLTQTQVDTIRNWISQGAQNN